MALDDDQDMADLMDPLIRDPGQREEEDLQFDDMTQDFHRGHDGQPLHPDRNVNDKLQLELLRDKRYDPKLTPRQNLRIFESYMSVNFRKEMLTRGFWKDLIWGAEREFENDPAPFTDALHGTLSGFEHACFGSPIQTSQTCTCTCTYVYMYTCTCTFANFGAASFGGQTLTAQKPRSTL